MCVNIAYISFVVNAIDRENIKGMTMTAISTSPVSQLQSPYSEQLSYIDNSPEYTKEGSCWKNTRINIDHYFGPKKMAKHAEDELELWHQEKKNDACQEGCKIRSKHIVKGCLYTVDCYVTLLVEHVCFSVVHYA